MATPSKPPYPLTTTTHSTPQLSSSPHLPALYTLINTAFDHGHRTGHRTRVLATQRLDSPAQLLAEIGPHGFCILAFTAPLPREHGQQEQPGIPIATASAKPYALPGKEGADPSEDLLSKVNKLFKRTGDPTVEGSALAIPPASLPMEGDGGEEQLPTWEILAMAVDPELQGRGIASQLLDLTIEEIRKRIGVDGQVKVKILLSTLKELNEGYYQRKGWRTTSERRFEAGVGGSEEGFGVVDMGRVVG